MMKQKRLKNEIEPKIITTLPHTKNIASDQFKFSSAFQNASMDTNSQYFVYPMKTEMINELNYNVKSNINPNCNYEINNQTNPNAYPTQIMNNCQMNYFNNSYSQIQASSSIKSSLFSYQSYIPKSTQNSTSIVKPNMTNLPITDQLNPSPKQKKIRKLFSVEEDHLLTRIMYGQPFTTWIAVAAQIPGRSARQCRDRWANYLSPKNKNGPWSQAEDEILAAKHREYGPQWSVISKFFDGRSENNVKNRWYTHLKPKYFSEDQINNFTKIRSINSNADPHFSNNITNMENIQIPENNKNYNGFNISSYSDSQSISSMNLNSANLFEKSEIDKNSSKKLAFSDSSQNSKEINQISIPESSSTSFQSNSVPIRHGLSVNSIISFNDIDVYKDRINYNNSTTYFPFTSQITDMNQKHVQLPPISSFEPEMQQTNKFISYPQKI